MSTSAPERFAVAPERIADEGARSLAAWTSRVALLAFVIVATSTCGGSRPATASSRDGHADGDDDGESHGDASTGSRGARSRDPLVALAGVYQPAGERFPRLELHANASYVFTTGSSPEQTTRGDAMLDERVLTLTPNVVGGGIEPIELAVRPYSGRTILLRGEQREAFDLVPSLRLGMLSRIPTDPPDAISLPDEDVQPNPAGPNGAAAIPGMFEVRASFPAAADRQGLRLEVSVVPHRVEISGCESRTPNRECGGIRRRTLGVSAWLEINRLWWATSAAGSCAPTLAPTPPAPAPAPTTPPTRSTTPPPTPAPDSFYTVSVEGAAPRTGTLPPTDSDPLLSTPCGADAHLVWWLESQFSLR